MTERNPYSQYSFDNYDRRRIEPDGQGFFSTLKSRIGRRAFAAAALLLTCAAFAGIIAVSYPDASEESDLPIIRADAGDVRAEAPAGGGVEVPFRDSTVFSSVRSEDLTETAPVENLAEKEEPVSKADAFAREAEALFADEEPSSALGAEQIAAADEGGEPASAPATEEIDVLAAVAKTAETKTIPMKTEKIPAEETLASENATPATETPTHHPAGASPDTLAYVKSILEEKDSKTAGAAATLAVNTQIDQAASAPQRIEPAAGAATGATVKKAGEYYVQLGSVTSEVAASAEWKRFQKAYASSLQGASLRVQRADLGDKGVRYRIQAGPMAKDSAINACNEIKIQKPAGCIIVQ